MNGAEIHPVFLALLFVSERQVGFPAHCERFVSCTGCGYAALGPSWTEIASGFQPARRYRFRFRPRHRRMKAHSRGRLCHMTRNNLKVEL